MTIWNYEILAQFKEARIGSNIITFDDLHKERNLEYEGDEYHCWVVKKDKRDYLLLNKELNKLPLRIKETKIITEGNNILNFIQRCSSIGFSPEKNYTFRELINEFYKVSHSNHPQFILFKIVAMASYIERINLRICSNVEFGKDGTFGVLKYLTNQVAIFSKPKTMAKLEYGVVNRTLVVNELVPKKEEERHNIGEFLLDMGDFKPNYEKKTRGSAVHGTRDSYDITHTSLIIFYNTIAEIADNDKEFYFDKVFGTQITERYLPLKFYGKLDIEQFSEKMLYNEHIDEELLKIARTIEWFKQNYEKDLKPYKADLSFIKISGRQRKSFERITYFLNLYSENEHEFKGLVNMLLKCYYDYENMIKNNKSLETFEEPNIQVKKFDEPLKVTEEFIEDIPVKENQEGFSGIHLPIPPLSPLDFIKNNSSKGEIGINEFLNNYSEDVLNELVRKGDVFIPNSKLIKVLE